MIVAVVTVIAGVLAIVEGLNRPVRRGIRMWRGRTTPAVRHPLTLDELKVLRRDYETRRTELTTAASRRYPNATTLGGTAMITTPEWTVPTPVPLANVTVEAAQAQPGRALLRPFAAALAEYIPKINPTGRRIVDYANALSQLDVNWDNRPCYRITDVRLSTQRDEVHLRVGNLQFNEGMTVSEVVSLELARATIDGVVDLTSTPIRDLLGDPFDLARNPVQASVATVTLVRDAKVGARFYLHFRNDKTADGVDHYHVVPAGVFQPSSRSPAAVDEDRNIWWNIVRETYEELRNHPDARGDRAAPIRYRSEDPYSDLVLAAERHEVRPYLLGIGLDPLQMQPQLLTACVFEQSTFHEMFGQHLTPGSCWNDEGTLHGVVTEDGRFLQGLEFTERQIDAIASSPFGIVVDGLACLRLAWEHREALLS